MAEIFIHPSLTRFTNNQNKVELSITSVQELIPQLCQQFPRLTNSILDAGGKLSPYVNCYINGKSLNAYKPEEMLAPNTKVDIVTALVGG